MEAVAPLQTVARVNPGQVSFAGVGGLLVYGQLVRGQSPLGLGPSANAMMASSVISGQ